MDKKINVLVFPCGSENGLEIHQALKDILNIEVFGASGKEDHGVFVYKNYIGNAPYISDPLFLSKINLIVEENHIDVIFPTHDDIALELAKIENLLKCKLATPGLFQAEICRSKIQTYNFFKNESFIPKVFHNLKDIDSYPIFAKPDKGQGGRGAFFIENETDLFKYNIEFEGFTITEFLPGEELTVDCFTDSRNHLRFVGPRKRNRVFAGISVNSYTVTLSLEIENIANIINSKLKMRGLWFFQLKKDSRGSFKLLEISVRVSGTMNLYRGLGINFPLLTIYDLYGYSIEILKNDYYLEVDRALINRYFFNFSFDVIYLDFDDTVTKNGKVNSFVMFFIYNMLKKNKKIRLITRHRYDIFQSLDMLCISRNLFDEIIQISISESKSSFIKDGENSIFIDNSFQERLIVKKNHNIPVFDVDGIPALIDWKE